MAHSDGVASGYGGRNTASLTAPFPATIGLGEGVYGMVGGWIGVLGGQWRAVCYNDGESNKIGATAASSSPAIESFARLGSWWGGASEGGGGGAVADGSGPRLI